MDATTPDKGLELRSQVSADGVLELSLAEVSVPRPEASQVLIRVEAAPINPSDLGLLLAGADMAAARVTGTDERPAVTATVDPAWLRSMTARFDASMAVGNEGAGTVVAAGDAE